MVLRGKKKSALESRQVASEEPETITDIQNYLASFNKEIQDGGTGASSVSTAVIESDGQSTSKSGTSTATAYYVTQSADGTTVEGFPFDQADGQFGTAYFASADGTYFTATDQGGQDAIAAFTAQGATVVPVTQQSFQTVGTNDHSGLQQIVLAVSDRSAGDQDGKTPDFVAIPATLTAQTGAVQGGETALIAMQAGEGNLDSGQDGQEHAEGTHVASTHTIRMVLRQADGTEIEQTIPISTTRGPSIITGDGQELHVNDEGTLQVISTIAEQAAAGALTDGNSQVLLNMANNYQTLHVVPGDGSQGEMNYMLIVQPADEDKDGGKELDLDMSVYDFNEGERPHGEVVSEEVAPDGTKTRTIRITQKKSQIVTQAHMCNYCNYTSPKRYLLSRHMKSHSEERPHKCGVCERGFKTLAALQNHVNTHTGTRPHNCRDCDSSFTTSGELVRHVRYRHTHEKPHRCTECDYASVELSKLKRHMRCHTGERPYQCPHCTYASPDMYKLKRHLRIHTGEKPYECDVCQARFTQSNSLKAHKLIHSGNKPAFHCEFCPTTCGRKTDLRIHMQKLHTSDKPLKCKRCGKTFPDRYSYKLHSKTHEGEKCFKCDLCPYASISQRHLESHMLIHTDQKPFRCDECDQAFRQKQLLRRHKNLYHDPNYVPPVPKEKTNECSECRKAFRHKGNLIRHLAIHDPEASENDKAEALRIGAPKGPGELPDGEEEEDDIDDDEDDLENIGRSFSGNVAFEESVQGQDNDNQVVVFEVIQLGQEPRESAVSDDTDALTVANGEGGELTVLKDVSDEQCYATDQVDQSALPEEEEPTVSAATPKRKGKKRGRPPKHQKEAVQEVEAEEEEIYDDPDLLPVAKKSSVEEINDTTIPIENDSHLMTDVTEHGETLEETETQVSETLLENVKDSNASMSTEFALREEELAKRRMQQKEKDMAECFGFNDDDDEAETILAMPTVPGVQTSANIGEGASNHNVAISSLS